ncbi:hypothetical protein MTO96_026742 [Rhipicephalus appendiculatus]
MLPASARHQDEDGSWIPVSYRRKQQSRATVTPTPSSGSQRKYPHTVILRPKQPCRIMDEQFIRLDRVITRHISAHLDLSEEDQLPEFTVRYLGRSSQLAVDAAEPEVRDALLAIASLPLSGENVPFHAYEAWNCRSFRNKRAEITTRFASKQDNTSPLVIALQEVNGPVLKIMGYDGYAPSDDLAAPTKTALYVRRGATHVQLDTQPWCSTTLSVVGCRVEVSSQRTLLVFCVYVVPENTRNKANKAPVDLSFISHFKKLYPQDTILLCGDFNSQHVAWGYNQCSPRGRRIMQDASEYRLTLLNTPQTHTRLAQTARQADTSPDLTWSTRPQLFRWEVLDDCMGSDHFPILIHFRTGYANTKKPNATTRLSHITHWDKYREFLQQQPPAKNIDHLVSQLCAAKRKATKNLRVPFDHPEPDRHLLTLWNRRLRILAQYRRSGHAAHHKARLRKMQRTIEEYTTTLASDRWMVICESINGQTHTSKVWAILRSLLGQRKTYNGAARVALREGISAQELAEQAAQGFFPQTSHPTDTTYQKDESSEDSEPLNSPFTMLELEHALQHANARSTPGADGETGYFAGQRPLRPTWLFAGSMTFMGGPKLLGA